mmetsp:Transcript_52770/g.171665  ORF Transcript_52770/g.171665 Transcript_52770/m.171665 type:complete len:294 (-) Transcript_52770:428-1309(-)
MVVRPELPTRCLESKPPRPWTVQLEPLPLVLNTRMYGSPTALADRSSSGPLALAAGEGCWSSRKRSRATADLAVAASGQSAMARHKGLPPALPPPATEKCRVATAPSAPSAPLAEAPSRCSPPRPRAWPSKTVHLPGRRGSWVFPPPAFDGPERLSAAASVTNVLKTSLLVVPRDASFASAAHDEGSPPAQVRGTKASSGTGSGGCLAGAWAKAATANRREPLSPLSSRSCAPRRSHTARSRAKYGSPSQAAEAGSVNPATSAAAAALVCRPRAAPPELAATPGDAARSLPTS